MLDESEIYIKELSHTIINLYKLVIEDMGYDMGDTNNEIEYHNYLVDDPIKFEEPFSADDMSTGDGFSVGLDGLTTGDPGETGLSDGMLSFICQHETGHQFGYKMSAKDLNGYDLGDSKGHKTYGYGILYHPVSQKFMDTIKPTWTQQELEILFKIHAKSISNKIDAWAQRNKITLKQAQKDAIASGCYNFGPGFLNKSICKIIAKNPNDPAIKNIWAHLSDVQAKKYPGIIKRRQAEANWYFS